jgi:3-carboxy-cis,cis-muconate cycloisomerase
VGLIVNANPAVSAADSAILGPLLGDAEIAACFTDAAAVEAMAAFEVGLARAEARHDVIPASVAAKIAEKAQGFVADFQEMGQSTAASAVPTIALVKQMRAHINDEASAYLHWGATSQDVIDTALILRLRKVLGILEGRLEGLTHALAEQARRHRDTVLPARTRYQQALPTSLGLKLASWLAPLPRQLARLEQMKPRLLCVQFGGAAGTLSALGGSGVAVMRSLADELGLHAPPMHWHSQRDALAELGSWLSILTGVLGKLGQDIALHQQSEVGEIRESNDPTRGGSSTMPQKANPIGAEAMVALARFNAGLLGTLHQALVQENERGGPGWQLEWMTLPQMLTSAGAALNHASAFAADMVVDGQRMQTNLASGYGLVMAEAYSFALAEHMPRPDAQALVKTACRQALSEQRDLIDVLPTLTEAPVDWTAVADPGNYLGVSDAFIERVLATVRPRGTAKCA